MFSDSLTAVTTGLLRTRWPVRAPVRLYRARPGSCPGPGSWPRNVRVSPRVRAYAGDVESRLPVVALELGGEGHAEGRR